MRLAVAPAHRVIVYASVSMWICPVGRNNTVHSTSTHHLNQRGANNGTTGVVLWNDKQFNLVLLCSATRKSQQLVAVTCHARWRTICRVRSLAHHKIAEEKQSSAVYRQQKQSKQRIMRN